MAALMISLSVPVTSGLTSLPMRSRSILRRGNENAYKLSVSYIEYDETECVKPFDLSDKIKQI